MASSKKTASSLLPNEGVQRNVSSGNRGSMVEARDSKLQSTKLLNYGLQDRPVDDFQVVDSETGDPDSKQSVTPVPYSLLLSSNDVQMVKSMLASGGKSGIRTLRVNTAIRTTLTSASGSALTTTIPLSCNSTSVTESVQFAALFDQARCRGFTVYARNEGLPISAAGSAAAWGLAYDPNNSGAYASLVGILVAGQHMGPYSSNPGGTNNLAGTYSMTSSGYQTKTFKCPPVAPTTSASAAGENVGGGWFATSDTLAIAGYLKPYVDSVTSTVVALDVFVIYHMEYRSRS